MCANTELKVAHVASVDSVLSGLLFKQLISIKSAGYDVVGISPTGVWTDRFVSAGFRHIPIHIERESSPLRDLVSLWQLYRLFRRERFTIVHTHNPKPGLIGQIAARQAGVPIVLHTIHGYHFHEHMSPRKRWLFITLERIASLSSDSLLSQNREDMRVAIDERICSPDKIHYLGNGIDLSAFDPAAISPQIISDKRAEAGLPNDASVVGFVGRLAARRKGFLDFLIAAREVAAQIPSVRFLIIGRSDKGKSDAVQPAIAEELGIADRCVFLGVRPPEEMPVFYRLMDILVLPSLFEGMPRAIMEASAMKVPVVASNVKGNRETVEHERNGLLVPLADTQALASAIVRILKQPERARQMGETGRKLALEHFDEEAVYEKVKREYERLLQKKVLGTRVHVDTA